MGNEVKKTNKKMNVILIIFVVLLIILGIFLFWFFNRTFDVTFNINNENNIVKVKYNKTIKDDDIKSKEELGEKFIGWFEIVSIKDNEEKLADEVFDFSTKIKEKKNLRAVFDGEVETITITFDSNGGSKVESISINKGAELNLPKNPTKNGYSFVTWELKNGTPIYNKAKLDEDLTLYAVWKKNVENITVTFDSNGGSKVNSVTINKGSSLNFPSNPSKDGYNFEGWQLKDGTKVANKTKFDKSVTLYAIWKEKEEKISLNLSRDTIHRNGIKTANAIAKVENAKGKVTYTIENNVCVTVDKETGEIKANEPATGSGTKVNFWFKSCANDNTSYTITATLPSGKSASAKINLEKDLKLYASDRNSLEMKEVTRDGMTFYMFRDNKFNIEANLPVTFKFDNTNASCKASGNSNTYDCSTNGVTLVTTTTKANQTLSVKYVPEVN